MSAAHNFLLSKDEASIIFEHQKSVIEQHWRSICDEAELNEVDRKLLWERQFLNPFSVE
ncbi:MAG: serine/threonine-protein kinase HipA [Candidatus Endobugula sp.]